MFSFDSAFWRNAALLDRSGSYGYPHSSCLAFHQNSHLKTRKNLIYSALSASLEVPLEVSSHLRPAGMYYISTARFPAFVA
jgi:hypothetical protein